ncbi:MAG TPA: hypothetical protein VGR72_02480 [Candidatus Acidoferrales bacterium]|nr:hypothetical protein [Candidatus Acidoferrales bacterium]
MNRRVKLRFYEKNPQLFCAKVAMAPGTRIKSRTGGIRGANQKGAPGPKDAMAFENEPPRIT